MNTCIQKLFRLLILSRYFNVNIEKIKIKFIIDIITKIPNKLKFL